MEWNGMGYSTSMMLVPCSIQYSIVGCCVDQKATSRFSKMIQVFKTKKGEKRKGEKRETNRKRAEVHLEKYTDGWLNGTHLLKESAAMKEEYEGIIVESEDQFKEQDSQYAETERLKVVKQRNLIRSILIPLDRKS
jgi:hypothetical protein